MRECAYPTCNELIPIDRRYCDRHKSYEEQRTRDSNKIYNKHHRDKKRNAFYQSTRWEQVRNAVVNRDCYTCQVCGNAIDDRKIVDHIVPLRIDGSKSLDTSNLWTLCSRCHNRKTMLENQILHSNNGINKIKHLTKARWIEYIKEFDQTPKRSRING